MKQPVLHQVHVTNRKGEDVAIGPRVNEKAVLEPMVQAINASVALGKEKNWRDARIVDVHPIAS